jgi:hypothetical protein
VCTYTREKERYVPCAERDQGRERQRGEQGSAGLATESSNVPVYRKVQVIPKSNHSRS